MDKSTQSHSSIGPWKSLATEMRMMEAREWYRRYKAKASTDGATAARKWLSGVFNDIERIRGLEAAQELRQNMNKIRQDKK